jgi:hypothetical protein
MKRFLVALCLVASATASAQPDWLPPELQKKKRVPSAAQPVPDDPCADPLLTPMAPPIRDSGFDRALDACLGAGWSASARGAALVDRPDFYGTLAGSLFLDLRTMLLHDLEIGVGARAVDVRYAQNAVISETEVGGGPVYLGVAGALRRRSLAGRPLRLAWGLRLDLPWTDSNYGETAVLSASPQLAAALGLSPRLALHGRIAGLFWLVRPPGDVQTRRAGAASTDLVWAPFRVLALAIGVEGQAGWYGAELDHLLVRGGARFPLGCRARLQLGAAAPLLGEERTDAALELGFSRDL